VYACSWNKEGTQLLTCSADKTAKIWDAATGNLITTFKFGSAIEDQQLGCLWQGDVSLATIPAIVSFFFFWYLFFTEFPADASVGIAGGRHLHPRPQQPGQAQARHQGPQQGSPLT
jgi:WD40 repeat protein